MTDSSSGGNPRSIGIDLGDGFRYNFSSPLITLGRYSSNDVPLPKNGISRRHAVIVNYPGDVWIYDLGSVTGIHVDGLAVDGKQYLDGVRTLKIGSYKISLSTSEHLLI
jgi:pSer/pThr/pTyr-binding forkhead associated (FHA) protein